MLKLQGGRGIMLNKFSIQTRLTLATCGILVLAAICWIGISIFSAHITYDVIPTKLATEILPANDNAILKEQEDSLVAQEAIPSEEKIPALESEKLREAKIIPFFQTAQYKFFLTNLFFMLGLIIIGTFLMWYVCGKALHPIKKLSNEMERIDTENLSSKLPVPESKDEILHLTNSFNNMIARIDESYGRQKRFSNNIAHELKTPLTTIQTNIEVLGMDDIPTIEDYKEIFEIIKENVERMTAMVRDLMLLNRAEYDSISNVAADELLQGIIDMLSVSIKKKSLNIDFQQKETINIRGNMALLERAFFNILHNAVRYTNVNGHIEIKVSKTQVSITDFGPGIPPEHLPHIFEPFYCVDASRSRELGGSGLGLSLSKQIFDKYDIKVKVKSEIEKYTRFIISFEKQN